jgi:hypothetical protein
MNFEVTNEPDNGGGNMVLIQTYTDPLNASYQGKAEKATFTFSSWPEQVDSINNFFISQYINECKNAVKSQSPIDDLLIIKVYRDTTPTWTTEYKIEITATDRTGNQLPWNAIALVGLALILTWLVVRPILQSVQSVLYAPDGGGGSIISNIPWIVVGIAAILVLPNLSKKRSGD